MWLQAAAKAPTRRNPFLPHPIKHNFQVTLLKIAPEARWEGFNQQNLHPEESAEPALGLAAQPAFHSMSSPREAHVHTDNQLLSAFQPEREAFLISPMSCKYFSHAELQESPLESGFTE